MSGLLSQQTEHQEGVGLGGLAAGVRVIWMNRLAQPAPADITPHAEVQDMTGLLAMLGLGNHASG